MSTVNLEEVVLTPDTPQATPQHNTSQPSQPTQDTTKESQSEEGNKEEGMRVKFGGAVTIQPSEMELARIERELAHIRDMMQGFPLTVERTEQKGRDIAAGEIVMNADPFASAVSDHMKTKVCSYCFAFSPNQKLAFSCGKCNETWYCNNDCKTKGITAHHKFECDFFKRMRQPKPKFDSDAYGEARLIIFGRLIYLKRMEDEQVLTLLQFLKIDPETNTTPPSPPTTTDATTSIAPPSIEHKPIQTREQKIADLFTLVANEDKLHPLARDYIEGVIAIVTRAMENYIQNLPVYSRIHVPLASNSAPSTPTIPPSAIFTTPSSSTPPASPRINPIPLQAPASPRTITLPAPASPRTISMPAPASPRTMTTLAPASPRTITAPAPGSPRGTPTPISITSPNNSTTVVANPAPNHPKLPYETFQYILDIICKQRCNRFGIWSKSNKCLGVALSPAASFFNHSCVPNCVHEQEGKDVIIRAVHPIPKGTEMCISYIKLEQTTDNRKEELFVSYHFYCRCLRCNDTTGIYDDWLQNFFCEKGKNCEALMVPQKYNNMDMLKCNNCGSTKPFNAKRVPSGMMEANK